MNKMMSTQPRHGQEDVKVIHKRDEVMALCESIQSFFDRAQYDDQNSLRSDAKDKAKSIRWIDDDKVGVNDLASSLNDIQDYPKRGCRSFHSSIPHAEVLSRPSQEKCASRHTRRSSVDSPHGHYFPGWRKTLSSTAKASVEKSDDGTGSTQSKTSSESFSDYSSVEAVRTSPKAIAIKPKKNLQYRQSTDTETWEEDSFMMPTSSTSRPERKKSTCKEVNLKSRTKGRDETPKGFVPASEEANTKCPPPPPPRPPGMTSFNSDEEKHAESHQVEMISKKSRPSRSRSRSRTAGRSSSRNPKTNGSAHSSSRESKPDLLASKSKRSSSKRRTQVDPKSREQVGQSTNTYELVRRSVSSTSFGCGTLSRDKRPLYCRTSSLPDIGEMQTMRSNSNWPEHQEQVAVSQTTYHDVHYSNKKEQPLLREFLYIDFAVVKDMPHESIIGSGKYSGEVNKFGIPTGTGTFISISGSVFYGQWENGNPKDLIYGANTSH